MKIIEEQYELVGELPKRQVTKQLILHHAAVESASAQAIHAGHIARGWSGIGYHYYIRKNGDIYRGRPEDTIGVHTQGMNACSIGICFEGNFENEEMGQAQLDAGRELIADIRSRYEGIEVKKHKDYNATACPGANFPFDELLKSAEEKDEPSEWAREAAQWAVENKIFVGDGEGKYRWHDYITREELAVLLKKLA